MSKPSACSSLDSKHAAFADCNGVPKRARLSDSDFFSALPDGVRLHLLLYADTNDLSIVAAVSRQCRNDCKHSSLPQERTATIICRTRDVAVLFLKIQMAEARGVFSNFGRLKLVDYVGLPRANNNDVKPLIKGLWLKITSLDISLPPIVTKGKKKNRQVPASLPKHLSRIMPTLRQVDLSNICTSQSALSDFVKNCPLLESIKWDFCDSASAFASGQDLKACSNLKALYLDNADFYVPTDEFTRGGESTHEHCMFEKEEDPFHLFYFCNKKLQRVSVKNATYHVYGSKVRKPLSQVGLIKFVRATASLRWFRSDLYADNAAILKLERPEITFVSE